jgi:nuclear pore complex protein Nup98-Nup96
MKLNVPIVFGGSQNPTTLFGNTTSGTGNFFGNNQQGQQQPHQQGQLQAGNAFGGLFGKSAQTNTQPQGNTNHNQQNSNPLFSSFGQSTQQNTLFGSKAVAPILGNSFSGSQGMSTGIFGASAGAQGSMTASISQPIGENLPIFAMLPPGPRLVNLEQNSPKKQGGFFVDVPTRSPVPRMLGYTPANSKLRGYGSSVSSSTAGGNALNGSMSLLIGKPHALALTKTNNSRASSLGPDGFLDRGPALGSGGRESVKKVVLDKKVEPTEFFVKSGGPGTLKSGKITFSPALGLVSRESHASQVSALQTQRPESPTPTPRTNRSPSRFTAQSAKDVTSFEGDEQPTSTKLKKGDYLVHPDLQTLKKSGHGQLSACEGLIVGRKGYGEIHFLEPVDLTGLPKLGALLGEVIKFDDKECSIYPDSEEVDKPPPGSGLNVKAKLSLEGCWAVDKATREPITDPNHPSAVKHLKRLKNMKDTHFDSFDMKTGTWTFTVDHF